VRALRKYKPTHLEHHSEQTMLACFFRNVSHTLPCAYLYDLASPALGACKIALRRPVSARSGACLGQFASNCVKWARLSMRKACPLRRERRITTACDGLASAGECRAAAEHTRTACKWSAHVRAVHFKVREVGFGRDLPHACLCATYDLPRMHPTSVRERSSRGLGGWSARVPAAIFIAAR